MGGQKILVAEDDPGVRFTIEFVLTDEGFDVVLAENGEQALALAKSEDPDLILLDNLMPKLDGPEVLEALKADPDTRDIPVIALSGISTAGGGAWGDTAHVQKPFAPDALLTRIRSLLEPTS